MRTLLIMSILFGVHLAQASCRNAEAVIQAKAVQLGSEIGGQIDGIFVSGLSSALYPAKNGHFGFSKTAATEKHRAVIVFQRNTQIAANKTQVYSITLNENCQTVDLSPLGGLNQIK